MRYHNILHDDMRNGEGLRVTVFVAGCNHHCAGCQNPVTWDPDGGLEFTTEEIFEIAKYVSRDYCAGVTFSGGDPMHPANRSGIRLLVRFLKSDFPDKTIWMYTGYTWNELVHMDNPEIMEILEQVDVLVDGRFIGALADVSYKWAGSTNQRVIDVQKSLKEGEVVLYESK